MIRQRSTVVESWPVNDTLVYVGTYTRAKSPGKGIYLFRLQTENLQVPQNVTLVPLGLAADAVNPSFLELDLKRRLLFAVNEVDDFDRQRNGAVSAFKIDTETGKLTPINQQPSMGAGPCHLVLDRTGRALFVANYNAGTVAVFPVGDDGRLGAASDVVQHKGRSVDPQRQEGPHAHCVTVDAANRFVFVCDLGIDRVVSYRYDAARRTLAPNERGSAAAKPGAGPRHMVFRPDGRFAYVVNELNSTVTVYRYDAAAGALREVHSVPTLPEHFDRPSTTAEIDVHPSGKWLYVSNRGHDSVVLFAIAAADGRLTHVEDQASGRARPRHFGIEPSGNHMAIGNQDSDSVLVCQIDAASGRLRPSGVLASVPSPVCMKFFPPAG